MSKTKFAIQLIIGFLPIVALWCIGWYFGDIFNELDQEFYVENENIVLSAVVPFTVVQVIPVLLCFVTIIGKRYNFKALYISAVVGVALPIVATALSQVFSNDGNILSWIYGLSIGLFLYPFGQMAMGTFDGVSSYYFIYKDKFFEDEHLILFYVVVIVLSIILYSAIKTKKNKQYSER